MTKNGSTIFRLYVPIVFACVLALIALSRVLAHDWSLRIDATTMFVVLMLSGFVFKFGQAFLRANNLFARHGGEFAYSQIFIMAFDGGVDKHASKMFHDDFARGWRSDSILAAIVMAMNIVIYAALSFSGFFLNT